MKIDLYRQIAAEIFNVKLEDVTPEQRAYAKSSCYFGLYSTRTKIGKRA